jgi:hypothetical protein
VALRFGLTDSQRNPRAANRSRSFHGDNRELTQATTADLPLLESNLVIAQGQRHRAGRDTSIQIRLTENLADLRRPMLNGVAGRALETFPRIS